MRRFLIILPFLALQMLSATGSCQERQQRASDVFPKDFVKGRGGAEEVNMFNSGSAENQNTVNSASPEGTSPQGNSAGTSRASSLKTTELSELEGDESNVVPVLSVGALLSIEDAEHLEQHLQELNEFNSKSKIPVSKVLLIGNPQKSLEIYGQLYRMGFSDDPVKQHESALILTNQRYLPNVPEQFVGVEYSPTWVIDTEFGMILVEGEQKKLHTYFDGKGNFKLGKIKLAKE